MQERLRLSIKHDNMSFSKSYKRNEFATCLAQLFIRGDSTQQQRQVRFSFREIKMKHDRSEL